MHPVSKRFFVSIVFISCLTIFGCLTIATFEPTRTTTIFDTKQPSLTEKSTENEGLSPATTRWRRGWDSNPCALARKLISSSCKAGSLCPSLSLISANFPQLVTALLPLPRKMHG